jgi:integrase
VGEVVAEFVERYHKPRNRSWAAVDRALRRELAPWWGRPLRNVTKRDVVALLDSVFDRAPLMANRMLAHLKQLFSWAVERDILRASPIAGMKRPASEESRDRVLTEDELVAVWRACDGLGWPAGPLVQLLILTAQRRGEVAAMAWQDVDRDAKLWTLPKVLTKAKRMHDVPLSPLALEIIGGLPLVGHSGLVFPSRTEGVIANFSLHKRQLDQESGVADWRLHDLRRTAADGMAGLGHPPHVVAAVLNHAPKAQQGVTSIYIRRRFTPERRKALEDWAQKVESLTRAACLHPSPWRHGRAR